MNTKVTIEEYERSHCVRIGDIQLTVIAVLTPENEWELCVQNARGIRATWTELYSSSDAAVKAGFSAIESEGAEEFSSSEGFDYLD